MATKDFLLEIFEPDGTTPREDYTETIGVRGDEEMVIRNFAFSVGPVGGLQEFSFTIYKDGDDVDAAEGDIIKASWDGTLRYFGKIDSISKDYSDTSLEYEDRHIVRGRGRLMFADSITFSLSESDGGTVNTDIQTLLDDLFQGGEYTDKGQANNLPIESTLNLITYTPANNVLSSLTVNVSYKDTHAAEIWRDLIRLDNGNKDLTSVEPTISYLKTNGDMITKARSTSILYTFDVDDADFPTKNSVDLADDGYRVENESSDIFNKFILNGSEITSLQYSTQVTNSRTTFDIRQAPPLDNANITIEEAQEWLDGFLLDCLSPRNAYFLRLRRDKWGMAPPWFSGSTDVPDGYIKLTEGGSAEVFNVPFQNALYILDSGGWDVTIMAGDVRPNIAARSRILTEFTGFGSYSLTGNVSVYDPSNSADDSTFNGVEIFDNGEFALPYENPQMPITVSNVSFKIYAVGGDFYSGGALLKTLTTGTSPVVRESGTTDNVYVCTWYNSTGTSGRSEAGGTIYGIGLPNDTVYIVQAWITINVNGEDHIIKNRATAFKLKSKPTSDKANDSFTRMPDAETDLTREYTPVVTLNRSKLHFFTNLGGDNAPDAGAVGWFITDDEIGGSWTRMTGDFSGTQTGTTNGSFTVDSDDSEGSFIYFNAGTGGASIRYNIASTVWQVNHDDAGGWVSLATGAGEYVEATYSGTVYRLVVDSADGKLKFISDPDGSATTLFTIATDGAMTTHDAVAPDDDGVSDIGSETNQYSSGYFSDIIYVEDIHFTSDPTGVPNAKLEWDGSASKQFAEGIALGFEDD